jgi:hypothetical protein
MVYVILGVAIAVAIWVFFRGLADLPYHGFRFLPRDARQFLVRDYPGRLAFAWGLYVGVGVAVWLVYTVLSLI